MKSWMIDDPVWRSSFLLCVGGSRQQALNRYNKALGKPPEPETPSRASGTVFTDDDKSFCLWLKDWPKKPDAESAGIIAHEAIHGAMHVLDYVGIKLCDASDEALTYYVEWVVREVFKRLWPKA